MTDTYKERATMAETIIDTTDNRTRPLTDQSQAWTPEHCKAYPRRAAEEIEYLRGQIASAGWRPIESAPKDGTEILVRYPLQGNVKKLVNWNTVHGYWQSKGLPELGLEAQSPDWHPLPPDALPPSPESKP